MNFGRRPRRRPPRSPTPPKPPLDELFVPEVDSPFERSAKKRAERNETAAKLVDDDTAGYLVLRLVQSEKESTLELSACIEPSVHSAFGEALRKVLRHGF